MDLIPALATASGGRLGDVLPPWSVAPFATLLLCIAVLPLVAGHLWESNRNKAVLSLALGLPVAIWMWRLDAAAVGHVAHEYVAFLLLLGVPLRHRRRDRDPGNARRDARPEHRACSPSAPSSRPWWEPPAPRCCSIRPLLRANSVRERKAHVVVFFIFIVSNAGRACSRRWATRRSSWDSSGACRSSGRCASCRSGSS